MYPQKTIYTCFPGGHHKALTLSFDDGRVEDRRLVAMLNQYGLRGTFNLNSGLYADNRIPQEEWPSLYQGQEIACHTAHHPTLTRCPSEQVAREVLEDRQALESLTGAPVRGMAYPNGQYSPAIMGLLPALGIRYARTVKDTHSFSLPENFLEWHPTCHFRRGMLALGEEFLSLKKTQYLYLMYVWGHSYELPEQDGWAQMEAFCRMMAGQADTWYATNIEIADYMAAAERLQFTVSGDKVYNPNAQPLWVSVNGQVFRLPGGALTPLEPGEG